MTVSTQPQPGKRVAPILLAEDDAELRAMLSVAFQEDGFDVIEAPDGNALLERLAEALCSEGSLDAFAAIISDIRMPGHTALEVLKGIRGALHHTPVILTTAFGDRDTHERARRFGAAAVVDKPFDIDDLRTTVYRAILDLGRSPPGHRRERSAG